ncbi:MAG: hydroxymyristoyl-ACP dehydratase, partial [Burkholderiales bacterium]
LHALHLAEYGAQAMAIHGGLLARERGERAPPGFLAVIRELKLQVNRLDDLAAPLQTEARMLLGGAGGWTYEFKASAGGRPLGSGRVTVMLLPSLNREQA